MRVFLEETVNHYNSNNRSEGLVGSCTYIPLEGVQSEGCAIGRKLPKSYKKKINRDDPSGVNFTGVETLFTTLGTPKYFKGIPFRFLNEIQELHDGEWNWDENGLREDSRKVGYIIKLYGLTPIQK